MRERLKKTGARRIFEKCKKGEVLRMEYAAMGMQDRLGVSHNL